MLARVGLGTDRTFCTQPRRTEVFWVVASLSCAGAALRVVHLGARSLWLDEAVTYWIANGSLAEILQENAQHSGGLLFVLALRIIVEFSSSEQALRGLACAAGIAAIPAVYVLCRLFVSSRWAYLAPILVAVAPTQVHYSQEVREYSMAFLVAVLILIAFVRVLRENKLAAHASLAVLIMVSVLLQYGLALLILSLNLIFAWHVLTRRVPARQIFPWTTTQVFGLLAVAVSYSLALRHQYGRPNQEAYLAQGYWNGSGDHFLSMLAQNTWDIFAFAFPLPLVFGGLCATAMAISLRRGGNGLASSLLLVPLLVALTAGVVGVYPYLGARQSIYLLPMFYVLPSTAADALGVRRIGASLSGLLVAALTWAGVAGSIEYLHSTGPEHTRPLVAQLVKLAREDDIAFVHAAATPAFRYYLKKLAKPWQDGNRVWTASGVHDTQLTDGQLRWVMSHRGRAAVMDLLAGWNGRVWFLYAHIQPQELQSELDALSTLGRVTLVMREHGAWLYVVDRAFPRSPPHRRTHSARGWPHVPGNRGHNARHEEPFTTRLDKIPS